MAQTIRSIIDERAKQEPNKVYLVAPDARLKLTYGQLRDDSLNFGRHLIKLGLHKGDKVSFMLGNGYQTSKIFLGTMYAGLVISPINLMAQPSQLEYVLDHSDTKLVFFTEDQKEKLEILIRQSSIHIDK